MKLHDQHLHSWHSVDSRTDPVANCEHALAAGLTGLTFTEHFDRHPTEIGECRWDYAAIEDTILALRERFAPQLTIGLGIEVDFQPELVDQTLAYLERHQFDVVLLSVHWAGGRPLHLRGSWQDAGPREMADAYLATLQQAVDLCAQHAARGERPFDVLSHLDYYKRYVMGYWGEPAAPIDGAVLDRLLATLVAANVVPEINTSGLRRAEGEPTPTLPILQRYRELGGTVVSIGSDAHRARDIGHGFDQVRAQLQAAGLAGEAVYVQRRQTIIPF